MSIWPQPSAFVRRIRERPAMPPAVPAPSLANPSRLAPLGNSPSPQPLTTKPTTDLPFPSNPPAQKTLDSRLLRLSRQEFMDMIEGRRGAALPPVQGQPQAGKRRRRHTLQADRQGGKGAAGGAADPASTGKGGGEEVFDRFLHPWQRRLSEERRQSRERTAGRMDFSIIPAAASVPFPVGDKPKGKGQFGPPPTASEPPEVIPESEAGSSDWEWESGDGEAGVSRGSSSTTGEEEEEGDGKDKGPSRTSTSSSGILWVRTAEPGE